MRRWSCAPQNRPARSRGRSGGSPPWRFWPRCFSPIFAASSPPMPVAGVGIAPEQARREPARRPYAGPAQGPGPRDQHEAGERRHAGSPCTVDAEPRSDRDRLSDVRCKPRHPRPSPVAAPPPPPPPAKTLDAETLAGLMTRAKSLSASATSLQRACCSNARPMRRMQRPHSCWRKPMIRPCSAPATRGASMPTRPRRATGTRRPQRSDRRRRSSASLSSRTRTLQGTSCVTL